MFTLNQTNENIMENLIHDNVVVSIRKITPANAAKILEAKNIKNRAISRGKLGEYINSMKNGEWLFNGDSIRISSDGVLLDGQHRLTAVARSGVSQYFVLIENMQKEVGLTIDIGKVRNGGDVLALEAGVTNSIAQTMSGAIKAFNKHESNKTMSRSGIGRLTNTQIVEEYKSNKDLIKEAMCWVDDNISKQGALLSKSEALAMVLILCNTGSKSWKNFCEMVLCGTSISGVCTQSLLRDYLLSCRLNPKKSNQHQRLCTIVKCWNSIQSKREITTKSAIPFNQSRDKFKKAM